MVSRDEAVALTVAVLKTKLQELGLPTTGKKDELVERYVAATSSSDAADGMVEETKIENVPAATSELEAIKDVNNVTNADAPSAEGKKIVFPVKEAEKKNGPSEKTMTEVEKAKLRAERFGGSHPELEKEKALKRAERFGVAVPELEDAKKKKRAERFGIEDEAAKIAKRQERFSGSQAPISMTAGGEGGNSVADDIMKARAARFAPGSTSAVTAEEAEKLKKRAERFKT